MNHTRYARLRQVLFSALLLIAGAESGLATPPAYQGLRYDENYTYLENAANRTDWLDPIKYIPLGGDHAWANLGGEFRERYEYFDHTLWGQGPQDPNGYWLQRAMLHADLHLNDQVRFFAQIKSGIEGDREGGSRATDEDRLDLHQAFVDVRTEFGESRSLTLRIGRQELAFGSSRLISFREAPNVRLSFDGVHGILQGDGWRVDALAVEPVQTRPGIFDDGADRGQKLWGVYAVTPFPSLPGGHLDLYYLGLERKTARFDQGVAREERHSLGVRLWGGQSGWDYNFEFVEQFGTFGSADIEAWTAASDTGFTFVHARMQPRLGLKADIASGDHNLHDGKLGTFNALFPRGAYFNESALIGPANLVDVHPSLTLQPTASVTVTCDADFIWRESVQDGLYGPAVNLLRSGRTSGARYVGTQPSLTAEWRASRHWTVAACYAHFYSGAFIRSSGPGDDVNYATTWITFKF